MRVQINRSTMGDAERAAVLDVLESGMLTSSERRGGDMVQKFEEAVRVFAGAPYAVAVSSGTAAIYAALQAMGVRPEDDVVMPSFVHPAAANAVIMAGATPVFADIGPDCTMTAETALAALTDRTTCVMPVHLYGHVADVRSIREAVGPHIQVLEDAAQALGSTYDGRHAGTVCEAGIYSFYPGKVAACGEGGVVVTHDRGMRELLLDIRNHGADVTDGTNLRLPEMSAAVGAVQMGRLDGFLRRRRSNAAMLTDLLGDAVAVPRERAGELRNWNLYTVSSPRRDSVLAALHRAGIGAAVYYAEPLHSMLRYRDDCALPNTDAAARSVLSLPVHPVVTEDDLHGMAEIIKSA